MSSVRYRHAMRPFGLGDELRVALRVDGACWGMICLHRLENAPGFSADEAALLAGVANHLAEGLRRAVVAERAGEGWTADGPGVAVVSRSGRVRAATPEAAHWLGELAELDRPSSPELPTAVRSVMARLRTAGGRGGRPGVLPRARVQLLSGRWLVVHASRLGPDDDQDIALVIEPAAPAVISSLLLAAYGLTQREGEVTHRLLAGLARKAIAAELQISLHTVNDYVKAVFDKTGASSAGQLRSRVFADHFAPRSPAPTRSSRGRHGRS